MLCQVYKSPRQQEMYLYVAMSSGLQRVPEALLARFGEPLKVMILKLDADQQLARVDTAQVRQAIEEQGFFLQMPPSAAELLAASADRG
jgi:uncharacterized protein YcgL (UPF0745 family)